MRRQIVLLTVLFVCSLPLVTKRMYASDEVQYYAFLRSLWFDHDVSFDNEFQHYYDNGVVHTKGFHETFLEDTTETGLRKTFGTIGAALLWSPFYAVADAIVHVRRALGDTSVEADGYSPPYIAAVAYGSAVYGWLSLVLSMLIARRVLRAEGSEASEASPSVIFAAALAVWIGMPLFFYMYIAPPMAHACSAFAVAAFVLTWLRVRTRWRAAGFIALGALAALMAMVREQDLFIALGPALDFAWELWHTARARSGSGSRSGSGTGQSQALALLGRGLLGGVAFGVAYLPQLLSYEALNGYPGPSRLVARKLNWWTPHALGVLISPEHGLLFWTPLVILSLLGLAWLAVRPARDGASDRAPQADRATSTDGRRVALCLLVMVVSQVYIAGSVESWTVAGAFGQRRFVGLTALFIVGLAAALTRVWAGVLRRDTPASNVASSPDALARGPAPVWRAALVAGVLLCIWWNLGLMAQFGAGLMDRQRLELGRNTYQTFVTIPRRLPELAYRYVFERRSFYQTPAPREP